MNKLSKSYIAGIIDGEGSICIVKTLSKRGKYPSRYIKISVGMSSDKIISLLKKELGGSYHKEKKLYNRKQMYRWSLSSNEAREFLIKIYPYLIEKKEQAKICLEFWRLHKYIMSLPIQQRQQHRIKESNYQDKVHNLNYGNETDKF